MVEEVEVDDLVVGVRMKPVIEKEAKPVTEEEVEVRIGNIVIGRRLENDRGRM